MKDLKAQIIKNKKIIIYVVIGLCLLLVNYMVFLKPVLSSLLKTGPKLGQLKKELLSDKSLVSNIPGYKAQIGRMRDTMGSYKKKFSTANEISYLLKNLSDMAKESNVKITSIKPHPGIEAQPSGASPAAYHKFPISIKAVSGYHQLGAFLNKLENDATFMRVSDLKITSDDKNPAQHLVYILVNTYVLNEA